MGAYEKIGMQLQQVTHRVMVRQVDAVLDEVRAGSPVRGASPTRHRPGRNRGPGGAFRDSWGAVAGGATVQPGTTAAEALAGWDGYEEVRVASGHPAGQKIGNGWSLQAKRGWVKRAAKAGIGRAS